MIYDLSVDNDALWLVIATALIVLSMCDIYLHYKRNTAERIKYAAPLSVWHSIRGRGFWKEDDDWYNE